MRRRALALTLVLVLPGSVTGVSEPGPAHHMIGGFRNASADFERPGAFTRWAFFARRALQATFAPRAFEAPRVANDGRALRAGLANPSVTWIGHATLLVQLDGVNVLTDPHWGERASPIGWAGPRRLSPPGVAFEDLPRIDVVLISHDHYDHLDLGTVRRLAGQHDPLFVVPLGLKSWLADRDITRVEELDWWGTHTWHGLTFHCVPAQHFSARSPGDANRRLWASWVLAGRDRRLYFSGDTGYFDGFRAIGERLGPFDLTAISIGAYLPPAIMRSVHMTPEEAVQAHVDLRGRVMLGIHWGTFDLADEPLGEPPVRMMAEAARRGMTQEQAWVLSIGETRRW